MSLPSDCWIQYNMTPPWKCQVERRGSWEEGKGMEEQCEKELARGRKGHCFEGFNISTIPLSESELDTFLDRKLPQYQDLTRFNKIAT